jgi:hypothetical protein
MRDNWWRQLYGHWSQVTEADNRIYCSRSDEKEPEVGAELASGDGVVSDWCL